MSPDAVRREDGIALITAILAVMILSGLAIVFVSTAVFQTQSTGLSRDFESVMHVAEAAADDLIPLINAAPDEFVSGPDSAPHTYTLSAGATPDEERAWALGIAEQADVDDLVQLAEGEGFAIRPQDASGEPMRVIYAVGWVPNRDDPVRTRVVKMHFDTLRYSPNFGLLSGGDVRFGGNASLRGPGGSLHANGNADPTTNLGNFFVERNLTAHGNLHPSFQQYCGDGATSNKGVQGECYGGAARQPMPDINARHYYYLQAHAVDGKWFDLCPPGTPDPVATIREPGSEPCTGDLVWEQASHSFLGWNYSAVHGEWRAPSGVGSGVFYVYQRNAQINGTVDNQQPYDPVTIIAEERVGDVGNRSGHITVQGSPRMTSALANVALIADRDIILSAGGWMEGLVGTNEQVDLDGSFHLEGAIIAQDAKDTPGSLVSVTRLRGTATINYDSSLEVPLSGIIRITAWNEL